MSASPDASIAGGDIELASARVRPEPVTKAHFGDPCIHCGTPHDDVKPGPCEGAGKPKPISYAKVASRWDGYDLYRVRYSDRSIADHWSHPSEHAPYFHFGASDDLVQPPRYDQRLLSESPISFSATPKDLTP